MAAPTPGQELASIDFDAMIGGPLCAVIDAQAQAAMSTVNFIKSVGFKPGDELEAGDSDVGEPVYVTFTYPKEIQPYEPAIQADPTRNIDARDAVPAKWEDQKLTVPLLTMLPVPFIRVQEATIAFNAKINSVQSRNTDSTFKVDSQLDAKVGTWFWSAKLKVSTSYQKTSSQGDKIDRTYSLQVNVRAVQDEMPAGMERILGILEDAIKSQPASAPEPERLGDETKPKKSKKPKPDGP